VARSGRPHAYACSFDAAGVRVRELEAAIVGDLDENRKPWLVLAPIAKTRRSCWLRLPDDLPR
jgi:hypothetical protein